MKFGWMIAGAALALAPTLAAAETRPRAGAHDSRVTYSTFVEGQVYHIPTRVRNITLVELGEGERISSIAIGDSESFQIDKLEGSNVFTIKPVIDGAATNITVETNRHFYFLRVTETKSGQPAWSVKFTVPGSSRNAAASQPPGEFLPALSYAVHRPPKPVKFTPRQIWDDGSKTFFRIPAGAPIPAVFRADARGLEYSVNTAVNGTVITVAGRSERWVLRYGDEYICITGKEYEALK